jgi:predicted signal transduction protein with EAL and GGDEF domain
MNSDSHPKKIKLRWYHIRRVKVTGEYLGGVLAGFGCGIALMAVLTTPFTGWSFVLLFGGVLSSIGSYIALHAQSRYTTDFDDKETKN